jgi:hypothetical protein
VEKGIPALFPLGRPQEKPRFSWVDNRRFLRRRENGKASQPRRYASA